MRRVCCRHKRRRRARVMKESNALLQEPCIYSDRESVGVSYKMIELRHAGIITSDVTSDVQAIELNAGAQCEACNLSQFFTCSPQQDRNIYDVGKRGASGNHSVALRSFGTSDFAGCNSNPDFPPPPVEAMQDCHLEDDKCCILDLVPPGSPPNNTTKESKSRPNPPSGSTADTFQANTHQNAERKRLPVDLTAPCNSR